MSRFEDYLNESFLPIWITRLFDKVKNELESLTFKDFEKKCEDSFKTVIKDIPESNEEILFRLENELDIPYDMRYYNSKNESVEINEDVAHLWALIKTEAFPTLAFYPALQCWLELDKALKGTAYSGKVIGFYAAFWLLLMSGKHIAQWNKWRKENPGEYAKERKSGKGGLL